MGPRGDSPVVCAARPIDCELLADTGDRPPPRMCLREGVEKRAKVSA